MSRYIWLAAALLLVCIAGGLLTACKGEPVVVAVDTLCVSTTRYHATETQRNAFKADPTTWESLVNWMATFNQVRDEACLKPASGA